MSEQTKPLEYDLNDTTYKRLYLAMMAQAVEKARGVHYSIKNDANGWRLELCK